MLDEEYGALTNERPAAVGGDSEDGAAQEGQPEGHPKRLALAIEGRTASGDRSHLGDEHQEGPRLPTGLVPYGPEDLLRAMDRAESPARVSVTGLHALLGRSRS